MSTLDEASLAETFRAALSGDEAAYRDFLRQITPMLRGLVHNKAPGLDAHTAEDVLQETLLAIHQKRHTWQQDKPVLPWLYAIARYKCIDALRARGRHGGDNDDESLIEGMAAPASTLERELDVQTAVDRLEGKQQAVVRLIGMEGVSISETGERLGMSEGAVRVAFHRGLNKLVGLRQQLLGDGQEMTP